MTEVQAPETAAGLESIVLRPRTRTRQEGLSGGDAATSVVREIYQRLRNDILDGTLRPNQLLVEAEIAEQMGVSRMPVREGLQRLLTEGLVESKRRRWVVHEFTRQEVVDIYEVRAALEAAIAKGASQRATAKQLAELHEIAQSIPKADTRAKFIEACQSFNRKVGSICGNPRMHKMLRLNSVYYATQAFSTADVDEYSRRYNEIYMAIASRDASRAEATVRHYVNQSLKAILARIFDHAPMERPRRPL